MKNLSFALVIAIGILGQIHAATIWENPITGMNPNTSNPYTTGDVVASNLTVSGIGRGTGITGVNSNNRYNASSWNTATLDTTAYFYFILTPDSGFQINFTSFTYTGQVSSTGPSSFAFRSSLDGFSSDIGSPNSTGTTISLSASQFQGLTTPIEFRFYGFGATSSGGTFSINDFHFDGVVDAVPGVPEAFSTLPWMSCGFVLFVLARQRKSWLPKSR